MTVEAMAPASTMPRPRRLDRAVVRAAAEALAAECVGWDPTSKAEDWVGPLSEAVRDWHDGYALARSLERYARVDPDADLVETLAGAEGHLHDAHAEAEKAWVRIVGFEPAFAVGDLATMRHGTGPIHAVDLERARYVVDVERRGNGGIYANAEDVTAPDAATEAA